MLNMPNKKIKDFQQIVDDFVPTKDALVSTQEVVKYFKVKDFPFALRTLTKYATMGLIPKPLHIGNKGYYEKDYIFTQLESIYILKSVVQWSLDDIKKLAEHPSATLGEIIENLHELSRSLQHEAGVKQGTTTIASFLANNPKAREMIDDYLQTVAEGQDPVIVQQSIFGYYLKSLRKG